MSLYKLNGFGYCYFTAEGDTSSQQADQSVTHVVVCDETHKNEGDTKLLHEGLKRDDLLSEVKISKDAENTNEILAIMKDKIVDEEDRMSESANASETESSDSCDVTRRHDNSQDLSHDVGQNVVLRRESSRSGPRPTTFPLCLLQPEVVSSSPEAQQ